MSARSFQDLNGRLAEVRALAGLDPTRQGDSGRPEITNAVNRACILLLSAHLEGFLEDLVQEALDFVVSYGARVERLPLLLRALHVEKHLRELEPIKDRNARAPRIERLFTDEGPMWVAGAVIQASMIKQNVVRSEMSNPGSSEIKAFLRYLDVDIEATLTAAGEYHLIGRVNGLILKRNQVAHGEVNANSTASDVDDYLTLVSDLCRSIHGAVSEGVRTICGLPTLPW